MGARNIVRSARGRSMDQAFRTLQHEAEEEYGHDYYNGEINNAHGYTDVTHKDWKSLVKRWEESEVYSEKGDCFAVCIKKPKGNSNKIKTLVERFPQKGTRKWVTYYDVTTRFSGELIGRKENLTDAIKLAREHTEKKQLTTVIHIVKILKQGNSKCAVVIYKKASKEAEGLYRFHATVAE